WHPHYLSVPILVSLHGLGCLCSVDATEIAKRLNVICAQLIPFLSQEHQQQVVQAVERAKQVTMSDLNAAIGHQLQTQHLSHHAPPIPLTPHPSGMQPPTLAGLGSASGLLALSGVLGGAQLLTKDDRGVHDAEHRGDDADKSEDNLVVDEVSAGAAGMGSGRCLLSLLC
uniref:Groucho/TLE N-terminal Q-rich domain-containing protein n=1 Tax=Pavo cristatus TaxID=9049 RepID=A0A8C9EUN0_PAVCR